MRKTWVFNDLHLGVRRAGGTTQASAAALRQWALDQFGALLALPSNGEDVIINGDLADQFDIPLADALHIYRQLHDFAAGNPDSVVYVSLGNHDLSKNSANMGAVEFVTRLAAQRPNVHLVRSPCTLDGGIHIIPHLVNQAEFDLALSRVPSEVRYLLLHCNFDSPFAEHSDHSLNISRAQAEQFTAQGVTLVLGHEHHTRQLMNGRVVIPGNQFPTSVADCITPAGRAVEQKFCVLLSDDGVHLTPTWRSNGNMGFLSIPVSELAGFDPSMCAAGFIKVVGEVQAEDAADALRRISKLRQASDAFVVVNGVKVRTNDTEIEGVLDGVDDVRKVDVVEMLLEALTPEQREAVKAVLAATA